MQDLSKAFEQSTVKEAVRQFLNDDEFASVGRLVESLESLYIGRALETQVDGQTEKSAEKMVRIALALESELFLLLNGRSTQEFAEGFYLIANVMEYSARIYEKASKPRFEYWLRASIAYDYAGYAANSIFCARQCDSLFENENELTNDILQLILYFISRRFKEFSIMRRKTQDSLNSSLQVTDDVGSKEEYFLRVGFSAIADTLDQVIRYMVEGDNNSSQSWTNIDSRAQVFVQKSGESFFGWLVTRLHYVLLNSISRSLWTKRDIIPAEIIQALTRNDEPIYELWPSQEEALRQIISHDSKTRTIISMPTSAGKTLVASIYLAMELVRTGRNAFYVTPLRALVDEISEFFARYFQQMGLNVAYLPGDYDTIPQLETLVGRNARIYVLTPEKLDLLWRANDIRLASSALFIFDEVQLIREAGRGMRLELLISKINEIYESSAKIVILSAVIPPSNIAEFMNWLGSDATGKFESVWSPTRIREGLFFRRGMGERKGSGDIMYFRGKNSDDPLLIQDVLSQEANHKPHVDAAHLAWKYQVHFGPVMVYANQKIETEKIAKRIFQLAKESSPTPKNSRLLEASREVSRLLGDQFVLPKMLEYGVAYHHASLPDDVKYIIQRLAKNRDLKVIVCTTTLAEGVNLNIKSAIISDTRAGKAPMDGIRLINLAGRAGRALRDTEGHVILMHRNMIDLLLDINNSKIKSRFFSYLEPLSDDLRLDTDANALEANLLARAYKKEISSRDAEKKSLRILKSTFFSKQANTLTFKRAYQKLSSNAVTILRDAENEDQAVLKVFAETGLGLSHCKILDKVARELAEQHAWKLRSNNEINWDILKNVLNACVDASSQKFEPLTKKTIKSPLDILKSWLEGASIIEIARLIDANASEEVFSNISYFIFGYVISDVAWAAAAFVKLFQHHAAMNSSILELDKEWDLLPNYLKYGTTNASALLLMISRAEERDIANRKGFENKIIPNSSYDWLRLMGWTSYKTNDDESFQKVKESLLSKLSQFTMPLGIAGSDYPDLEISESGDVRSNRRVVSKMDPYIIHLLNAIKTFAKVNLDIHLNEKREWEVTVIIVTT